MVLILFPQYWCFFRIRFTFFGILYNTWNTWVSPSISIAWENAVKSIEFRKPRKLVPIFSLTYGYFPSMTILRYILLPQRKCMAFPIKIHYTSSLVVFSQYYLCTCSKVYWFLKRKSKKNSFLKKKKKKKPIPVTLEFKARYMKEWMDVIS